MKKVFNPFTKKLDYVGEGEGGAGTLAATLALGNITGGNNIILSASDVITAEDTLNLISAGGSGISIDSTNHFQSYGDLAGMSLSITDTVYYSQFFDNGNSHRWGSAASIDLSEDGSIGHLTNIGDLTVSSVNGSVYLQGYNSYLKNLNENGVRLDSDNQLSTEGLLALIDLHVHSEDYGDQWLWASSNDGQTYVGGNTSYVEMFEGGDVKFHGGVNVNLEAVSGDIALWTGGNIRMDVTPGGNIGVGTTSPATLFHIEGNAVGGIGVLQVISTDASISEVFSIDHTQPGGAAFVINNSATGGKPFKWMSTDDSNGEGGGKMILFDNTTAFPYIVADNATQSVYIGTVTDDASGAILQVNGNISAPRVLSAGDLNLQAGTNIQFNVGGTVDFGGVKGTNLADPVDGQDAATKAYVDGVMFDTGSLWGQFGTTLSPADSSVDTISFSGAIDLVAHSGELRLLNDAGIGIRIDNSGGLYTAGAGFNFFEFDFTDGTYSGAWIDTGNEHYVGNNSHLDLWEDGTAGSLTNVGDLDINSQTGNIFISVPQDGSHSILVNTTTPALYSNTTLVFNYSDPSYSYPLVVRNETIGVDGGFYTTLNDVIGELWFGTNLENPLVIYTNNGDGQVRFNTDGSTDFINNLVHNVADPVDPTDAVNLQSLTIENALTQSSITPVADGTYAIPTSVTIVSGIITAIS